MSVKNAVGRTDTNGIAASKTNNGLRSIAFVVVDQEVACGLTERMLDTRVELRQRLKDVFTRQAWWDRLRHRCIPDALSP